ncbi:hypothetical protein [Prochlorococcus marinus]|uniref:hypothetical protein n=1 Tax=Prochlorococcus marinus TaxID=1219 RepID=UPI0022B58412|nr:hypothetical protein [Prochlorococcus marinus]
MSNELSITKTLKTQDFSNIDIDLVLNYLQTLDYDLKRTRYIGKIISKNERLAKYFFFREKLKIEINSSDKTFHITEILDQCIDWSEFWRLLVVKKGFCCIRLSGELHGKSRFIFLSGPNILSEPSTDLSDSIYQHVDY